MSHDNFQATSPHGCVELGLECSSAAVGWMAQRYCRDVEKIELALGAFTHGQDALKITHSQHDAKCLVTDLEFSLGGGAIG